MLHFVLVLLSLLSNDTPRMPTAGTAVVPVLVAPSPAASPAETKLHNELVRGITALEFQGLHLSPTRRSAIATSATVVSKETGVDPFLLIALARMESDFIGVASVNYQCKTNSRYICSADCGITQHHVTGPGKWVMKYCKELQRDDLQTFRKSAEELVRHVEWCQARSTNSYWGPLELCVLNRYNQGPYYRRDSQCENVGEPGQERSARKELRRRCLIRAAYWKRVMCFHYGAASGKALVRSCRYTMNVKDIPWFYGESKSGITEYVIAPVFKTLAEAAARQQALAEAAKAAAIKPATSPASIPSARGPAN